MDNHHGRTTIVNDDPRLSRFFKSADESIRAIEAVCVLFAFVLKIPLHHRTAILP